MQRPQREEVSKFRTTIFSDGTSRNKCAYGKRESSLENRKPKYSVGRKEVFDDGGIRCERPIDGPVQAPAIVSFLRMRAVAEQTSLPSFELDY
jgi:hypothetical protein